MDAASQLLENIHRYFDQDTRALGSSKVRLTALPPIYLQQPGILPMNIAVPSWTSN